MVSIEVGFLRLQKNILFHLPKVVASHADSCGFIGSDFEPSVFLISDITKPGTIKPLNVLLRIWVKFSLQIHQAIICQWEKIRISCQLLVMAVVFMRLLRHLSQSSTLLIITEKCQTFIPHLIPLNFLNSLLRLLKMRYMYHCQ